MQDAITINDEEELSGVASVSGVVGKEDEFSRDKLDLTPHRHEEETLDEYHARFKRNKVILRRHMISQTTTDDNRAKRRKHAQKDRIRMTKPLKKVRGKWFVGEYNVSKVINKGEDLQAHVKELYRDERAVIDELEDTAWKRDSGELNIWEDE